MQESKSEPKRTKIDLELGDRTLDIGMIQCDDMKARHQISGSPAGRTSRVLNITKEECTSDKTERPEFLKVQGQTKEKSRIRQLRIIKSDVEH